MKCPCCPDSVLAMSDRQGIEIDYCPSCRGIWLDRGELDKIIEKSKLSDQSPTARPTKSSEQAEKGQSRGKVNDVLYRQDYFKHKRKKSFLEELFD